MRVGVHLAVARGVADARADAEADEPARPLLVVFVLVLLARRLALLGRARALERDDERIVGRALRAERRVVLALRLDVVRDAVAGRRRRGDVTGPVALRDLLHDAAEELGGAVGPVREDHLRDAEVVVDVRRDRDGAALRPLGRRARA